MAASPLTLYHLPAARSTRVLWLYRELEALYDNLPPLTVHVFDKSTFREEKPAWYLAMNPMGKVPALVHGEVCMFESLAICLYLLQQFDTDSRLAPLEDPVFSAKFYQFAFYSAGTLDNLTATSSPLQRMLKDPRPGEHPDVIEENHKAWVQLCGPVLVDALGTGPFMFGESFTALDIVVGMNLHWILSKRGWAEFPQLHAYFYERCNSRPSFQGAIEDLPPSAAQPQEL